VDLEGKVIGINTAIASNSGGNDGIGFSIPSNLVQRVVSELLERGQVRRAYLGVMLDPDFTSEKAKELKLDRLHGTRVARVYPRSPASQAGLLADDVVVTFEGVNVIDENHLINLVSLTEIGRKVVLGVIRAGQKVNVTVLLSNRQELPDQSAAPRRPGMGTYVAPLGLSLHELTPQLALQLGFVETARGVLVLRVDAGSPLAQNVQVYDLIDEVAATPVASIPDVQRLLAGQPAGSDVLVRLKRRAGATHTSRAVVWRP
jgi:serine protease Do